ncbi:MAG: hypothetical protein JSW41_02035 [Candidatus Aenigmatarchaeota archaeon]|nr:MAG: hypothetical protein JSW41_02035 [Candidatus Aenigmarchaeota archaeon]
MDILRLIFGWNWRVRRLRKHWDRAREKALRKENPIRKMALEKLDVLENNLRILEEQKLNRMTKARLTKELQIGIAEVKALLKSRPEEFQSPYQKVQPVQQKK